MPVVLEELFIFFRKISGIGGGGRLLMKSISTDGAGRRRCVGRLEEPGVIVVRGVRLLTLVILLLFNIAERLTTLFEVDCCCGCFKGIIGCIKFVCGFVKSTFTICGGGCDMQIPLDMRFEVIVPGVEKTVVTVVGGGGKFVATLDDIEIVRGCNNGGGIGIFRTIGGGIFVENGKTFVALLFDTVCNDVDEGVRNIGGGGMHKLTVDIVRTTFDADTLGTCKVDVEDNKNEGGGGRDVFDT